MHIFSKGIKHYSEMRTASPGIWRRVVCDTNQNTMSDK